MTTGDGRRFDVQLLAELEADALDGAGSNGVARLREAVDADPAAAAVLAALAATRAELAALPMPPLPPDAAERWAAALQAEADQDRTVADGRPPHGHSRTALVRVLGVVRRPAPTGPSRRRLRVRAAAPRSTPARHPLALRALAAAVLFAALTAGLLSPRPSPPSVDQVDLAAAGRSALGRTDLGAFADPARRAGCLRTLGVLGLDPDATPLGGRRVDLARGPGVLLVFATGELGVFDVVVVDPACGPAGGTLLGTARVGR